MTMRVKVILPSGVLLDREAGRVVAEARNGSFCLLPRHVDFLAALAPGILVIGDAGGGEESYVAVDEGILVKHGAEVLVSTANAVAGELGELRQAIATRFLVLGERERQARIALDHLEASLMRQILEGANG